MKKEDLHVHTRFSTDSDAIMSESVEVAIKRGLKRIAFTEHWDEDYPEIFKKYIREAMTDESIRLHPDFERLPIFTFDVEEYFSEIGKIRKSYGDKIEILSGIEFGLKPGRPDIVEKYRDMMKKYNFDIALGSIHLIDDTDPYYGTIWYGKDPDKVIERYFEIMAECVREYDFFTSLSHLDYPARYVPKEMIGCPLDVYFNEIYEKNREKIDDIFRLIISRGQALEINTRGMFTELLHVHPAENALQRYIALGGNRFTYGSDAHFSEKVGDGIDGI